MKNMKRILALVLALIMTFGLVACGRSSEPAATETPKADAPAAPAATEAPKAEEKENDVEPITDLMLTRTDELLSFNILHTESATTRDTLINLVEGFVDNNNKSQLIPALATEWGSEDNGLTWTFKIRNNSVWVDVNGNEKAPVVAADFETGMEFILNFHKNSSYNTAKILEYVTGAKDYYKYTESLSAEEALALTAGEGSKFLEMVGIETPDDYTVTYHLIEETPYFDSLVQTTSYYPLAQGLVDELGVENVNNMNNETMWYNGPYTMTTYINGNEHVMTKNPKYWDTECTRFETVTYKVVESADVAYMLFENGENDYVTLGYNQVMDIYNNPDHKFHDYLIEALPGKRANQIHLNFNKLLASTGEPDVQWNKAVNNEAFRKALYYGIDFVEYYKRFNPIDPMKCENNFYTRADLIYMSDGTQYVDVVREEMGIDEKSDTKIAHLDADKSSAYKKQAMEELAAEGVTFPVVIEYYVAAGQTNMDNALVLEQCMEDSLGKDFIDLKICEYTTFSAVEVRDNGFNAFHLNSYAGAYADPSTYLFQETYGDSNAYYTDLYSRITSLPEDSEAAIILKEYTRLYDEACDIVDDHDARMKAFAKAEAYFFDHVITIPVYVTNSWCLSNINLNSKMYSMLSGSDEKMKNWETDMNGYTREEMEAIYAAD